MPHRSDYGSQLSERAKDTSSVGSVLKPGASASGGIDSFKEKADKIEQSKKKKRIWYKTKCVLFLLWNIKILR